MERHYGRPVEVVSSQAAPIREASLGLSAGLFRVTGLVSDAGAWSVVLKVLRPISPAFLARFPEPDRALIAGGAAPVIRWPSTATSSLQSAGLMLALLAVGHASVGWRAAVAAVIFIEKVRSSLRLTREPEPPALVTSESDWFNIRDLESGQASEPRSLTNPRAGATHARHERVRLLPLPRA